VRTPLEYNIAAKDLVQRDLLTEGPYSMPQRSQAEVGANPADAVPATAVSDQLARIVNSPRFISSARLCRFLTHIVNHTIHRDPHSLKEFSIALEVFDRTSEYDPNIDAIVRVEARRLRTKLKEYYEGPGRNDPVLIGLRPGSYIPIFRWLDPQSRSQAQEIGAAIPSDAASVAVLPFVNISPDPEQDYFCDGISEEIINLLTHIPGLKVIARSSAFQFKGMSVDIREVGRRLDADVIIEGSVRKAGEQLRITAQAIQAESGHGLWSETFARELKDVFAIQEEIAQAVGGLLRLHMREGRPRVHVSDGDLEAYTRYVRARVLIYQQSPETLRASLRQLRELIEVFPDYAAAYSGIAEANGHLALFGFVSGRAVYPEMKATAERGYALNPESGETCTVLGGLRAWFDYRRDEAYRLYERALKLQPGLARTYRYRAMALLCQGDIEAAESGLRRSTELDPLSASDCARTAYVNYVKSDFPSAAEDIERSFDLDRDYPEARFYQGLLRFQQEDYGGVVECLSQSGFPLDIGVLAAAYARQGRESIARECVERLSRLAALQYVSPLAEAFAAIGMKHFDLAFQRLNEAIDDKTAFVNLLAVEPFFEPLRSDQRFTSLLKRLNLAT
jgi:adenylate cyclase